MKRKYIFNGTDSTEKSAQEFDGFVPVKEIIMATNHDGGHAISHEADDDDIVEMVFDDGSFWMGRSGELPDYFDKLENRSGNSPQAPSGVIEINGYISANVDATRGSVRDVFVKIFRFLKPEKLVVPIVVAEAARLVDEKVQPNPGLYQVGAKFELTKIDKTLEGGNQPYLLLLHGIISDVEGSLKQMFDKDQEGLWNYIQTTYSGRVIALQHYTLTKSPIENTIDLLQYFPSSIKLHVISHSRGGLIGEFLSHFHAENGLQGFDNTWKKTLASAYGNELMEALDKAAEGKNIFIEKFIRVACPAQGTTISSDHLDVFLNTILNIIRLALPSTSPVVNVVKRLLAAVLDCKENPDVLPGVEATRTESVFIRALNHPGKTLTAPLAVIAGNAELGLNKAAFATMLTKVFFKFKMNDWMIDTRYMLRGTPRHKPFPVLLDQGKDVSHTNYFERAKIQTAIKELLKGDVNFLPAGFQLMTTQETKDFNRGLIMGSYTTKEPTGNRPIVVLLPGILGSNLSANNTEIYLQFLQISVGGMKQLAIENPAVQATSVIGSFYKRICQYLDDEYDVVAFPFDWRKSVKNESAVLAKRIADYLDKFPDQSVSVVAHSMGGLVARHLSIDHEDIWKRMNERNGFRLLLLGSPLGGSYMIPEVLIGEGARIKQMASLDITNNPEELLSIFSRYHGLQDLLPIDTSTHDFTDKKVWLEMKNRQHRVDWVLPTDEDLKRFAEFRDSVLQKGNAFYENDNVIYVAGKANETPESFYYKTNNRIGHQIEFVHTERGDGSVTWASGIPAAFGANNRLYYVDTTHGDLAKDSSIFGGIRELLKSGTTSSFSRTEVTSRKRRFFGLLRGDVMPATEENLLRAWMGDAEPNFIIQEQESPAIEISVSNSDLVFADYPLMTGHLMNDIITSAEAVLDNKIGGKMSRSHALGNYPNEIGSSQVFQTDDNIEAIIVGLGANEKLSAYRLEQTITLGVVKYLLEIYNKRSGNNEPIGGVGLSVLFIGTGYAGFSLEASIMAIVTAINKANKSLVAKGVDGVYVSKVELIEIYQDKAIQALLALKRLRQSHNLNFEINPGKIVVKGGTRKRFVFENNSDWWKRITISAHSTTEKEDEVSTLRFVSSWASARAEQYNLEVSIKIIEKLLADLSKDNQWNAPWAKTLFELLIPQDFKSEIQQLQPLLLLVDKQTAQYPWELLQDGNAQGKPISTQVGIIRQLATTTFRRGIYYPTAKRALVIGDPVLDGYLPQLQGALAEAKAVNTLIASKNYESVAVLGGRFLDIVHALYNQEHKILHLAGHGVYDKKEPTKSGMVIGDGVFLSAREIVQLPYVPEIVFVNCCYLGEFDSKLEDAYQHRNQLAASIGLELIDKGVKAVIVAGWAVNDHAAKLFAESFYNCMFDGYTFGEAVLKARKDCYDNYTYLNTWGAYQCYGDYSYRLESGHKAGITAAKTYDIEEEIEIDLLNISTQTNRKSKRESFVQSLKNINDVLVNRENTNAYLYELLAINLGHYNEDLLAYSAFKRMLSQRDATYSMNAIESYCSILKRIVLTSEKSEDDYISDLNQVIVVIDAVQRMHPSAERHFLIGTAHQTLYIQIKKDNKKEVKHLEAAINHIKSGLDLGSSSLKDSLGAIANLIAIDTVLEDELNENLASLTKAQKAELEKRRKAPAAPKTNNFKAFSKTLSDTLNNASKESNHSAIRVQLAFTNLLREPTKKRFQTLTETVKQEEKNLATRKEMLDDQHTNVLLYLHTLNPSNKRVAYLEDYRKFLETL